MLIMEKIKLSFKEKIVKIRCEMSVTVTYENSDGIINITRLKFISCGEEDRSSCVWLTDESYVNFACLYCDWNSYSPMMELYNDTLSYIENYLVPYGYAKIRSIDSTYEKFEFTKKIVSSEFERSSKNRKQKSIPTHVLIKPTDTLNGRLKKTSVAITEQLRCISKDTLVSGRVDSLNQETMNEIEQSIKLQLGIA